MNVEITLDMGIEAGVNIGGGSPAPEPSGSDAVLTGTPTVQMSGTVLPINSTIYGTAEEVN